MKYRMALAATSLIGVLVAAYLYLYKIGKIGTLACGTGGCETVQASEWAMFLGIEVSLIGLVGYVALLIVGLASLQPAFVEDRRVSFVLVGMSGLGFLFALYLTWLELFVIHAICRWCVGSAVIITLIFVLAVLDLRFGDAARPAPIERRPS